MQCEFYSGSYGTVGEDGIVRFQLDTERETLEKVSAYQGIRRPSWLEWNAEHTVLYAVQETDAGAVHALKVCEAGLQPRKILSTDGADPCHLSFDPTGRLLFAANYGGSLAVFRVGENSIPLERSDLIVYRGTGASPARQNGPHIHCSGVRGGQLFVVDLGLDQVSVYALEGETLIGTRKRLRLPAGSGPRHLEFHPSLPGILYIVCELTSQIAVFRETPGGFDLQQTVSTLPDGFAGHNTAAAIHIAEPFLFVSNRGHDSIALFETLPDGTLKRRQILSSGGKTPRDFAILDGFVAVANQDSNSIHLLRFDRDTGELSPSNISASTVKPSRILPC